MLTVTFQHRETHAPLLVPGVQLRVERLEWRALGGPWSARLSARADTLERLWRLTDLLRCGLTVHDDGGPAWWGYVSAVELGNGASTAMRLSLEALANSAAAGYRAFTPDAEGGSARLTAFQIDARSIERYGEKQRVIRMGQAAEEEALACARRLLAESAVPQLRAVPHSSANSAVGGPYAWIVARGWWETLDWKIAAEPRGRIASPWGGAEQAFGSAEQPRIAQPFSMESDAWAVAEAWLRLRRVSGPEGGPTDAARLELCADAGGSPGAAISSASLNADQLSEAWGWACFRFPVPLALASGRYWLVLSRSGALSSAQYYLASADPAGRFAGGQLRAESGAGWSACLPTADLSCYLNGVEETTEQARRQLLPERCGQFLRGARIEARSGVQARLYRQGADDALRGRAVLEALLARGTADGRRLLARIEPDRTARVYLQPAPNQTRLALSADGALQCGARPLLISEQPAGQWARLEDLAPAGAALEKAVFIERCAWEGGTLRILES